MSQDDEELDLCFRSNLYERHIKLVGKVLETIVIFICFIVAPILFLASLVNIVRGKKRMSDVPDTKGDGFRTAYVLLISLGLLLFGEYYSVQSRLNYCHSDEFKQRLYPQTFENCVSNARVGFWGGMFEDLMFSLSN